MHIKTYINSLLRKINIGKSFRWYLKRYDMALWDWYFFHCESHSEILSVNPNKTFILDQSHTRVCGILLFFVRDGACLCKSNRKSENAHKTHELGFTAHKKFWKSHSDLIVWHKKIIICLLNANCCFLVWAWDFFFSFQCVWFILPFRQTQECLFSGRLR